MSKKRGSNKYKLIKQIKSTNSESEKGKEGSHKGSLLNIYLIRHGNELDTIHARISIVGVLTRVPTILHDGNLFVECNLTFSAIGP